MIGKNLYKDFTPGGQWCICVYTSILALTGNDIYPQDTIQNCLSIVILLSGAIFIQFFSGTITVFWQSVNKKSHKLMEQLDIANNSMMKIGLSGIIQEQVREYLLRT